MIALLFKIIVWTIKLSILLTFGGLYCCFQLFIIIIKIPYKFLLWVGNLITNNIFKNHNYQSRNKCSDVKQNTNIDNNDSTKLTNLSKEKTWNEVEFEKEAALWGLSKEERRIAKEERMTPAEFIEAEERTDDELLTDEWEK